MSPDFTAEPAVIAAIEDWRAWLLHERRISKNTYKGYSRDLRGFFRHMAEHLGFPPGLQDLEALSPADFRGFLAKRHAQGLSRASTARAVSTTSRSGRASTSGAATDRSPRRGSP